MAYIEVHRVGKQNALDVETARAFLERCREVNRAGDVRAMVLSGGGKSFGVGGDLSELKEDAPRTARKVIEPLHQAVEVLVALDAPAS